MTPLVNHDPGSGARGLLELVGVVPWEWLAGCRDCGLAHEYRSDPCRRGFMTWASEECDTYRPRVNRHVVDVLMVEHRAETEREVVK